MGGFLEKRLLKRSALRWAELSRRVQTQDPKELRSLLHTASGLRNSLDQFSAAAENALLPEGQAGIQRPDQCDWAWRPEAWSQARRPAGVTEVASPHRLSDNVTLFHDCARSEITLRQIRTCGPEVSAPFGLMLDVYRFDGSFLSIVLSLPQGAISGLTRNHFFSLRAQVQRENPIEIYARINIQHGPNTEQIVRQLDLNGEMGLAEFDLAYGSINEKRVEKAWIDLILDNPAMNQVILRDLTLTRAPRADM